jgi:hypothetical protein
MNLEDPKSIEFSNIGFDMDVIDELNQNEPYQSTSFLFLMADIIYGCTNKNATNYNKFATFDDNSCFIQRFENNTLFIDIRRII